MCAPPLAPSWPPTGCGRCGGGRGTTVDAAVAEVRTAAAEVEAEVAAAERGRRSRGQHLGRSLVAKAAAPEGVATVAEVAAAAVEVAAVAVSVVAVDAGAVAAAGDRGEDPGPHCHHLGRGHHDLRRCGPGHNLATDALTLAVPQPVMVEVAGALAAAGDRGKDLGTRPQP